MLKITLIGEAPVHMVLTSPHFCTAAPGDTSEIMRHKPIPADTGQAYIPTSLASKITGKSTDVIAAACRRGKVKSKKEKFKLMVNRKSLLAWVEGIGSNGQQAKP